MLISGCWKVFVLIFFMVEQRDFLPVDQIFTLTVTEGIMGV